MSRVRQTCRATCASVDIYKSTVPEHVFESRHGRGVSTIEVPWVRRSSGTRLAKPSAPVRHLSMPDQRFGRQVHQHRSRQPTSANSSPPAQNPSCARTRCTSPNHSRSICRTAKGWRGLPPGGFGFLGRCCIAHSHADPLRTGRIPSQGLPGFRTGYLPGEAVVSQVSLIADPVTSPLLR